LAGIAELPRVSDWWVVASPADGKIFHAIGPDAITEVLGEPTPEYIAAGE
jgi:hypothetical protein